MSINYKKFWKLLIDKDKNFYYESPRIKPVRAQMIGCFHVCGGA